MNNWLLAAAAMGAVALVNGVLVILAHSNERTIWTVRPLAPVEKLGFALVVGGGILIIGALFFDVIFARGA